MSPPKAEPAFDPDAYLQEHAPADEPGFLDAHADQAAALGRGAVQGATLGFGDELKGGVSTAQQAIGDKIYEYLHPDEHRVDQAKHYREVRNSDRSANAAAQAEHPELYGAGELGGTLATSLVPGVGGLAGAAALGGAAGLGYGDADLTGNDPYAAKKAAIDTALGAGLGAAGYGAGKLVGKGLQAISGKAGRGVAKAEGRAIAKATAEHEAAVKTARSEFGASSQKANRMVENLDRLRESLGPEHAEALAALEQDMLPGLRADLAESNLKAIPGLGAEKRAAAAKLSALTEGADDAIRARAKELLTPSIGKDAWSFGKSYATPFVTGYAGHKIDQAVGGQGIAGGVVGGTVGLMYGRSRAGLALMNRINKPGSQMAAWSLVRKLTNVAPESLGKYAGVLQRAAARGETSLGAAHYVLSQTDPGYRQHMADLEKQQPPEGDQYGLAETPER